MSRTIFPAVFVTFAALAAACGGPEPRTAQQMADDGVPANSLSESRLNGNEKKGDDKKPDDKDSKDSKPGATAQAQDPTQPLMTPLTTDDGSGKGDAAKPKSASNKTGPVSKQECEEVVDHGLDLLLGSNPQFAGIPPEMIAQFKAQARQDKAADNPCSGKGISRAEYNCGMAANNAADFQKCSAKPAAAKPKK